MDISTYSTYILLAVAWLFPLVSNFVARQHWPKEIVGILTLLVSAVGGFVSEYFQDPNNFHLGSATYKALLAYILAAFAHEKIWKNTATDRKTLAWPRPVPPGGVQPGEEPTFPLRDDDGEVGLLLILIIAALLIFGAGFAFHLLWWLLVIVVIIFLYDLVRGRRV